MAGPNEDASGCDPTLLKEHAKWKNSAAWKNRADKILSLLSPYIISDIIQMILDCCCNDGCIIIPKFDWNLNRSIPIGRH
jgi:hypothetical protein